MTRLKKLDGFNEIIQYHTPSQRMKILGAGQSLPPNVFTAFKWTGLHMISDRELRAFVTSVDLATAQTLEGEQIVHEFRSIVPHKIEIPGHELNAVCDY
jgi:hypothetical protein